MTRKRKKKSLNKSNKRKTSSTNIILVIFGIMVVLAMVLGPLLTLLE
jgi:flagellar basal body-associated protein FliL